MQIPLLAICTIDRPCCADQEAGCKFASLSVHVPHLRGQFGNFRDRDPVTAFDGATDRRRATRPLLLPAITDPRSPRLSTEPEVSICVSL